MSRLWNRMVRVLHQSRIRLPRRPFLLDTLRRGDWIQIESSVWRVKSLRRELGALTIVLETRDGRASATLLGPGEADPRWTFRRGRYRLDLPEEALLVFPAGREEENGDISR